ncbi:DMT family transporter [Curvibacter sp. HBC28]|uniref:DMT family transporter n=1 Tax=Curvibacter microcysteis TaxID=3026419 RepID=A0ABT5MFJ4_9BURK|nr:DMT family transporter [Curvibacter sp. HBC28]MDD0814789.1 DMT family transporter [Curvibacter sp. HBC28]
MPSLRLSPISHAARVRLSDLTLLAVAAVWGSSYGVAKGALLFYPVLGFLALRFGLTLVVLLPVLLRLNAAQWRDSWRSGVPLGAWLLGIFLAETYGVSLTQASNAAFLISLCVVITPWMAWWRLGQRPGAGVLGWGLCSVLGAGLLSGGLAGQWVWGDVLILLAAVLRALMVCETSRLSQTRPAPALALTAVQAAVVALGSAALAGISPGAWPALPSAAGFWWAAIYLVLGCTVFAFFAQNWALRHSPPARVALLMSSEPVFGALWAVLLWQEQLAPLQWLGGGLMVLAALATTWRRG